jgi:hypothetical protein
MKIALVVVALALIAWFAFTRTTDESLPFVTGGRDDASNFLSSEPDSQFSCDGRTHCSQMTSCAEAEFFLQNCPGVKMDGNGDGEPCEGQWCGDLR